MNMPNATDSYHRSHQPRRPVRLIAAAVMMFATAIGSVLMVTESAGAAIPHYTYIHVPTLPTASVAQTSNSLPVSITVTGWNFAPNAPLYIDAEDKATGNYIFKAPSIFHADSYGSSTRRFKSVIS